MIGRLLLNKAFIKSPNSPTATGSLHPRWLCSSPQTNRPNPPIDQPTPPNDETIAKNLSDLHSHIKVNNLLKQKNGPVSPTVQESYLKVQASYSLFQNLYGYYDKVPKIGVVRATTTNKDQFEKYKLETQNPKSSCGGSGSIGDGSGGAGDGSSRGGSSGSGTKGGCNGEEEITWVGILKILLTCVGILLMLVAAAAEATVKACLLLFLLVVVASDISDDNSGGNSGT